MVDALIMLSPTDRREVTGPLVPARGMSGGASRPGPGPQLVRGGCRSASACAMAVQVVELPPVPRPRAYVPRLVPREGKVLVL